MNNELFYRNIDRAKFVALSLFIIYVFWYQYAIDEVSGVITALGIAMVVFELLSIRRLNFYKGLNFLICFLVVSALTGYAFSNFSSTLFELLLRILKYYIPMISIYSYVGYNRKRLYLLLKVFVLSSALLAISSLLTKASITATGAISVGDLNTNILSCYLFFGVMSSIILLDAIDSFVNKIVILGIIGVFIVSQVNAASRRGFIIMILCLLAYVHSVLFIKLEKKSIYKLATIILVILMLLVILDNFNGIFGDTVLMKRFFSNTTNGDQKRKVYQACALGLFSQNPIFGKGFGAVQSTVGMYSHSLYYELLASTGIVGTGLLLFPIMKLMVLFFRSSNDKTNSVTDRMHYRMFSWWIVATLLTGIAVVYIYDANFYMLLGVLLARMNIVNHEKYVSNNSIKTTSEEL